VNVYLDASVIVRLLLGESNPIEGWGNWKRAVSSRLLQVEVWRAVHRLRLVRMELTDSEFADLSRATGWLLAQIDFQEFSSAILRRSTEPFRSVVGALDAIHLSSALAWQSEKGEPLTFFTHDEQLGRVAKLHGFKVRPAS